MDLIKDLWNILVLVSCISTFGRIARNSYKLGISALDLHQKGIVSLTKYN